MVLKHGQEGGFVAYVGYVCVVEVVEPVYEGVRTAVEGDEGCLVVGDET